MDIFKYRTATALFCKRTYFFQPISIFNPNAGILWRKITDAIILYTDTDMRAVRHQMDCKY